MNQLQKLEQKLDDILDKNAPFKLPPNGRKGLAQAMWWIALIIGVLMLWATFALWHLGHAVDRAVDVINSLSTYYGGPVATPHLGLFYFLSLIAMGAIGMLMLLAAPLLKNMKKAGWDLLFYAVLFEALLAVLRLFSNVGGGAMNFLGAVVGAVIGAYFLFQVRDYFVGGRAPATATHEAHKPEIREHQAHKHEAKKDEE